jgi:hypothetical protein
VSIGTSTVRAGNPRSEIWKIMLGTAIARTTPPATTPDRQRTLPSPARSSLPSASATLDHFPSPIGSPRIIPWRPLRVVADRHLPRLQTADEAPPPQHAEQRRLLDRASSFDANQ